MQKLSAKLSPQAKKAVLSVAQANQTVSCLVQVSPAENLEDIRTKLEALGASVRSSLFETNLLTVEVPASQLAALAEIKGVVYVETSTKYSR